MKNRSNKVVLKLTPIDPEKRFKQRVVDPLDVIAVRNQETNLWHMRFNAPAATPMNLQVQFTNFNRLIDFVSEHYSKRNLKIEEMIDEGTK